MALSDDFAETLLECEDVEPQKITIGGTDYPGYASGATRAGKVEAFGLGVDLDLVVIVRANLFATPPASEQTLVYRGTTYRIKIVLTAPGASFIRLACKYDSLGA